MPQEDVSFELSQAIELHTTTVALVVIVDPKHEILCRLCSTPIHVSVELPLAEEALLAPDAGVTLTSKLAGSRVVLLLDFRCELRV